MKKYPKIIYIQRENAEDEEYWNASDNIDDILYDTDVAIYELKVMKKKKTTITLE